MNWKNYTEKLNSKTFVLPAGWDTKDEIAEQLDCSVEKVDDHLRPALKSGAVIKQQFKVWDDNLKRNAMVWAYQEARAVDVDAAPASSKLPFDLSVVKKMKAAGKSWREIGAAFGRTNEAARNFYRVKA